MKYQGQMLALIEEMDASITHWLPAQYNDAPPEMAQDATPSKEMQRRFRDLARKWQARFDKAAPKIAEAYLVGSFKATGSAMRMALKDAGFSVKFTMTPAVRDAFEASLAENVALIKSIPTQYLANVENTISRAYSQGQNIQWMIKRIKAEYPKAASRAVIIARDQSNKAHAVCEKARRLELGITKAIWMHSGGGKHPRPEHVAANGREFEIAAGCPIKNEKGQLEYIMPGEKINCRCVSRSVLPIPKAA